MALFKIEKGLAANLTANRPNAVEGYCYFTSDDGKFYIDIANGTALTPAENGGKLAGSTRMPINSYLSDWAARAYADKEGKEIVSSYGNRLSLSNTYTLKLISSDGTELSTITLPKNVDTASKFTTAQIVKLTGAVTGETSSQAGWTVATTLADNIVQTKNIADKAITNAKIANPSFTLNGKKIDLGGSATLADIGLGSALRFIGITTTAIVDGSTATSVVLKNGNAVTASVGDVVINSLNNQEYLWTGSNWELLGDESSYEKVGVAQGLIDLIKFNPVTDSVLGSDTTFTTSASSVSFGSHSKQDVVGPNATFSVTNPTISVTPSKTNVKATASGTKVTLNTASAVTGIGNPTTSNFVTSYPGTTSKLVTTTIQGISGTTTVSKISANTSVTATKVNNFGTAAKLEVTYTADTESLVMSWTPNTVATGTDVTATNTAYSDSTVAVAAEKNTTVATGSLSTSGTGSSVMTGLGTANTATAITAMGQVETKDFATSVNTITQPTIALATGATAGTGVISLVSGISSASASGGGVAFDSKDLVSVITGIGAATAAAQKITIGANDKVSVLTSASNLTKT